METFFLCIACVIITICICNGRRKDFNVSSDGFNSYSDYKNHVDKLVAIQDRQDEHSRYNNRSFKPIYLDLYAKSYRYKPYVEDIQCILNTFKNKNVDVLCKNGRFGILICPATESVVFRVVGKSENDICDYPMACEEFGCINTDELDGRETYSALQRLYKLVFNEEYKV